MQRTINREMYLNWLLKWRGQQIIKVISGVRRCGKSTLFAIYRDYLQKEGIGAEQIISLNFEDIEYEELCDYRKLYSYISQRLLPEKMNYIFLDEVQHVECFEKAVDKMCIRDRDGYEIYKSTKKNSGYKHAFTTKNPENKWYKNTAGLKKGTMYYYKVRAFVEVDGQKYYSDWSNKAYRKAK